MVHEIKRAVFYEDGRIARSISSTACDIRCRIPAAGSRGEICRKRAVRIVAIEASDGLVVARIMMPESIEWDTEA
jgi:hypothetical protein